tara:strand:+ start:192 stop:1013 length:822 start_codon:yes stop_codon:yes gene_type:complete
MRRLLVALFAVDDAAKRRCAVQPDNYRGFIPLRFFTPNRDNGAPADAFEGYKLHWECPPGHPVRGECSLYGSNLWPDHLPEMPDVVTSWWSAMEGLADRLLIILANELGLDYEILSRGMEAPLTNVTLLHYPAKQPEDRSPGFHPHKDISVVTMLDPDPVGGLEVRTRDGRWVKAFCPEGALLINVGDVLEVWSGGRLVSTPHRVSNVAGAERYSAPFFVVPNHAVVAEPLLAPLEHFEMRSIPMGYVQSEVWRTNWPDQVASDADSHLGGIQ